MASLQASSTSAPIGRTKPWYVAIQEHISESEQKRARDMSDRMTAIKRWAHEAIELVRSADLMGQHERRLETEQLISMNGGIDHDHERESLKLEAIASIHHIPERKRAKRRRYMMCIKRDHLQLRHLEDAKIEMFEGLWQRSELRRSRHHTTNGGGHGTPSAAINVITSFGARLSEQATAMLANTRTAQIAAQQRELMAHKRTGSATATSHKVNPTTTPSGTTPTTTDVENPTNVTLSSSSASALGVATLSSTITLPNPTTSTASTAVASSSSSLSSTSPTSLSSHHMPSLVGIVTAAMSTSSTTTTEPVRRMQLHRHSMTPNLQLINNHMTVVHQSLPDVNPQWGVIHATCAPRQVLRTQSSQVITRLAELERDLDAAFGKSAMMDILENVVALCEYANINNNGEVPPLIVRARPSSPATRLVHINASLKRMLRADIGSRSLDEGNKGMKPIIKSLLDDARHRLTHHGRYYFEVHGHSRHNTWIIGWALPPFADSGFSFFDTNQIGFGVHCDGSVFDCGQRSRRDGMDIKDFTMIGVTIDLLNGSIGYSFDDGPTIPVFGYGAMGVDIIDCERQRRIILSGSLIPTCMLLGARLPSTNGLHHTGGRLYPSPHTTPRPPRGSRLGVNSGGGSSAGRYVAPMIAYVKPQISINFGSFELHHCPMDTLPANTTKPPTQQQIPSLLIDKKVNENENDGDNGGHNDGRLAANDDIQLTDNEENALLAKKAIFFESLMPDGLLSWSNFPPRSIRVHQAVLKVQRIARRFIGFKRRKALWKKLTAHTVIIQRTYRDYKRRQRVLHAKAVIPIQALYRGWKTRKAYRIYKKYNLKARIADSAATKIQSIVRMMIARKRALVAATMLAQQIEHLTTTVIFVQRMFRRKLTKKTAMTNRAHLHATLIFQKTFRGSRLRRKLAKIDPHAAKELSSLGDGVILRRKKWSAVLLIQRLFRGWRDRSYAEMRRQVIRRDMNILALQYRQYQLRDAVDQLFKGHMGMHVKSLLNVMRVGVHDATDGC